MLKPAEQTSLTALRLADLVAEAGFPAGVINIITGNGDTAGDRLVRHPDVDKVAFTGSTEIGKLINRNATDTLKRVTLELGGKSPVMVLPDVDVAATARRRRRRDLLQLGPGLRRRLAALRAPRHFRQADRGRRRGRPSSGPSARRLAPDTRMGPLVSNEQHERVMGYIDQGKQGRRLDPASAATRRRDDGYFVNPTILVDVKPEMSVVREEIFGPVVVAQRFDDLDEVAKRGQRHQLRPRRQRLDPRRLGDAQARAPSSRPARSGAIATR